MDSMIFYTSSSAIPLNSFSTLTIFNFKTPFLPLKEIANGSSTLAYQRSHRHISNLSLRRFNGNNSGHHSLRTAVSGRFRKRDDKKINQSSDSNSANQDEIISLFRRIQSSISKEESLTRKKSSKSSEEKPSAESVLDDLQQLRTQMKANTLNERGEKVLSIRRGQRKNDDKTDFPSVSDLKLTRPPSNFVKRSPIPTSPNSRPNTEDKKPSPAAGSENSLELEKVEEMKLPALKELAKSRGLKGYSKLKKSELIELLRP